MKKIIILTAVAFMGISLSAQKAATKSKKTSSANPATTSAASNAPVAPVPTTPQPATPAKVEATHPSIHWASMNDALAKTAKTKKKILIDFFTDWCGWCKRMDKTTYEDPKVVELMNKYFIPVKFNAESEGPIKYKGQEYSLKPQGIRSTHELAILLLNGQMGYPTTTFLDGSNQSLLTNIPGYIDAKEMALILKYFGEDKHLTTSYETYKREETSGSN